MSQAVSRPMSTREWAMLAVLSLLWGGSFFFVGVAVKALPPLTIVALRVGGAALILNLVRVALGQRLPGARLWRAFFLMAVLNNAVPFLLFTWGQTEIASGLAAILNATTPLFAVLVAHVATRDEKATPARLAGALTGFLGVVVMIGPGALGGVGAALLAELACLGAAFSYALAGVFGRRFAREGVSPLVTATAQVTASTALLAPLALLIETPWRLPPPGPGTWVALAGLAALSTALGYILYFRILATAGATNILLVTLLVPVSAILFGVAFLGEAVTAGQLAGMALIGAGLALVDGRVLLLMAGRRARRRGAAAMTGGRRRDRGVGGA